MGPRDKLKRLNKLMRGNLEKIPQRDGSTYFVDPAETFKPTFLYWAQCARADYAGHDRPEPPEALKAVAGAVDRKGALKIVMGRFDHLPVDKEALVEVGEFHPIDLGRENPDFFEASTIEE